MKKSLDYVGILILVVVLVFFLRWSDRDIDRLSAQERQVFPTAQLEPQAVRVRQVSQEFPFQQQATQPTPFGTANDRSWNEIEISTANLRSQNELQTLRNEYSKIAQGKAALMNLQELKDAVAVEREELAELKAEKELAALVGNLGKLIEKYPQSKAAKEARRLLGKPDPNAKPDVEDEADDFADPGK